MYLLLKRKRIPKEKWNKFIGWYKQNWNTQPTDDDKVVIEIYLDWCRYTKV